MAKTAEQLIEIKDKGLGRNIAFPVASGETIYQGTVVGVATATGLLHDLDATVVAAGVRIAGIVMDSTANANGPAATTAAGSISGDREEQSVPAGDKTVRRVYVEGIFKVPTTGLTQAAVGAPLYASDNYTFTTTSTSNQWIGTIVQFISATEVYVDLNKSYKI